MARRHAAGSCLCADGMQLTCVQAVIGSSEPPRCSTLGTSICTAFARYYIAWCVRQGITQLGLIFMQMGVVSFSVAIVDLLTAAVRWPGVALVIAVCVAGVSVLRMLALAILVTRYSPHKYHYPKLHLMSALLSGLVK